VSACAWCVCVCYIVTVIVIVIVTVTVTVRVTEHWVCFWLPRMWASSECADVVCLLCFLFLSLRVYVHSLVTCHSLVFCVA
jgi:hypothetical protein